MTTEGHYDSTSKNGQRDIPSGTKPPSIDVKCKHNSTPC